MTYNVLGKSRNQLMNDRGEITAKAIGITDAAKTAGRDLTPREMTTIDTALADIKAIDARVEKIDTSAELHAKIGALGPGGTDVRVDSPLFSDEQRDGLVKAARTKTSYSAEVQFKAPILQGTTLNPATGSTVVDSPAAKAGMSLRDLFTPVTAQSAMVRYYTLTNGTAGTVAEGALKPDAGITAAAVDKALLKIAATFQVSDELAEDAPFLVDSISRETQRAVMVKENEEIVTSLNVSGIATGTWSAAAGGVALIDALAAKIGASEALNGVTPTAILANPTDVATIRQAKASSAGSYFLDPLLSAPSALHGVPLLSTAATAAGTVWLVTEGAGLFYTRGTLRVEAGFTGDDWVKNLMTVRVEERVLPVVVRPSLVTKITQAA